MNHIFGTLGLKKKKDAKLCFWNATLIFRLLLSTLSPNWPTATAGVRNYREPNSGNNFIVDQPQWLVDSEFTIKTLSTVWLHATERPEALGVVIISVGALHCTSQFELTGDIAGRCDFLPSCRCKMKGMNY